MKSPRRHQQKEDRSPVPAELIKALLTPPSDSPLKSLYAASRSLCSSVSKSEVPSGVATRSAEE